MRSSQLNTEEINIPEFVPFKKNAARNIRLTILRVRRLATVTSPINYTEKIRPHTSSSNCTSKTNSVVKDFFFSSL